MLLKSTKSAISDVQGPAQAYKKCKPGPSEGSWPAQAQAGA